MMALEACELFSCMHGHGTRDLLLSYVLRYTQYIMRCYVQLYMYVHHLDLLSSLHFHVMLPQLLIKTVLLFMDNNNTYMEIIIMKVLHSRNP